MAETGTDDLMAGIVSGDTSVFKIKSQTTQKDKRTLLAVQNMIRAVAGDYTYIEIGSHLGGSLVPHLADPACSHIASIDPRPVVFGDERGRPEHYAGNSTERMIACLAEILPVESLTKMRTYDCDAADLGSYDVARGFTLGLIDGEHTNAAAFRDFLNLRKYMAADHVLLFHDANLVFDAIANVRALLDDERAAVDGYYLPGILFALVTGHFRGPAAATLGPIAHDPEAFVARARRNLHERIAKAAEAA